MNSTDILKRLRATRVSKGLSHTSLAKAIGCSVAEYSQKELGREAISTEEWLLIADMLKVPVETFFLMIPSKVIEDGKKLIYSYHRLSLRSKITVMTLVDVLLYNQWCEAKEKGAVKEKQKKRSKNKLSLASFG
jgi:transcriptional regulator with XRE-family HTH domain